MMMEVAKLVSDSPCSSVLLSEVVVLSTDWVLVGIHAGISVSRLGVTWKRPTMTTAGWIS